MPYKLSLDFRRAQLYFLFLTVLGGINGCASRHETASLQCLGFCSYVNINHEVLHETPQNEPQGQ